MTEHVMELPSCAYCYEYYDPRPENPGSEVCEDCLHMAIDIVRDELQERGLTIPSCLEPAGELDD